MSVRSAAIKILKKAGTPLHFKEIAKRIKDAGLWTPKGKTPQATISAYLYSDKSTLAKVSHRTFTLHGFAR